MCAAPRSGARQRRRGLGRGRGGSVAGVGGCAERPDRAVPRPAQQRTPAAALPRDDAGACRSPVLLRADRRALGRLRARRPRQRPRRLAPDVRTEASRAGAVARRLTPPSLPPAPLTTGVCARPDRPRRARARARLAPPRGAPTDARVDPDGAAVPPGGARADRQRDHNGTFAGT